MGQDNILLTNLHEEKSCLKVYTMIWGWSQQKEGRRKISLMYTHA